MSESIAQLGRTAVPLDGLEGVAVNTKTILVAVSNVVESDGLALLGSDAVPIHGLFAVALDAKALTVTIAEDALAASVTLFC